MIKLKDLLFEKKEDLSQWDSKLMGKPLSKGEIVKLKKKLKAPEVRDPKKGSLVIPPKLSDRESHHIIYVMLKKMEQQFILLNDSLPLILVL